jgi:hypothetical protein
MLLAGQQHFDIDESIVAILKLQGPAVHSSGMSSSFLEPDRVEGQASELF